MLAIILGILKWIGLLILILLGSLVTLILLVLLVPIRYRAEGSYHEKLRGHGAVTWLLHLISVRVRYGEVLRIVVRICGFRVFDSGREEATEELKENKKKQSKKKKLDRVIQYEEEPEEEKPEEEKPKDEKLENKNPVESKPEKISQVEPQTLKNPDVKTGQKKSASIIQSKLQSIWKKIRVTFHRFCDTLKGIKDKKDTVLEFIHDEENQNTFRLVKKQVFALLKHILPGKLQGKVRFGFDDPYTTGQILTYVSPFYGLYAKHLQLIPSFEEPILDGELKLKGRIRVMTVLVIGIRVLLDKNFRRLLKKFRES